MPDWIIPTLVFVVALAAFIGAVAGTLVWRTIARHIKHRDSLRFARRPGKDPSAGAQRVLTLAQELAEELRMALDTRAIEDHLKGPTFHA
jgi:hypothetical protein